MANISLYIENSKKDKKDKKLERNNFSIPFRKRDKGNISKMKNHNSDFGDNDFKRLN